MSRTCVVVSKALIGHFDSGKKQIISLIKPIEFTRNGCIDGSEKGCRVLQSVMCVFLQDGAAP